MATREVDLQPLTAGRYIVAVSGGVDSMVLLDMLRQRDDLELIVAHANHGQRHDAHEDEALVATFCKSHNITFIAKELDLKANVSEAAARTARYNFLQNCRIEYDALSVITAHHQDDLIETALINMLRGTGWRGLAPFVGRNDIVRPLVDTPKAELVTYAKRHAVPWREDSTNSNQQYLRNYVRLSLIPRLQQQDASWRSETMRLIRNQQTLRRKIEGELNYKLTCVVEYRGEIASSNRYLWIMTPTDAAYELLQALFRRHLGYSLVRNLADAALLFAKVAKPGKCMPLGRDWQLRVTSQDLIVEPCRSVVS